MLQQLKMLSDGTHKEGFTMEVLVSAVLGDVISRTISFFMDRYHQLQAGGAEESLQRLRHTLLRVQATVEEAERRHITNQAMLRQLETLRQGMYRGYYVLDAFRCRSHGDGDAAAQDEVRDHSFALSIFNPAKRLCLSATTPKDAAFNGKGLNELRKTLGSLEMIVADMQELVVFLRGYPLMHHELCSNYLFSDRCMFGRHAEYERIVSFLLQVGLFDTGNLGVLPIIGPARVGKSTLVEHVCYDERVRDSFSSIVFFSGDDLEAAKVNALQDSGVVKYRNGASPHGRLLIIMELFGDLDKEIWRSLCSLLSHMAHGSKIIITSRSERILHFGTTQALKLKFLPQEAFWYFFKMVAFRSADSKEYPELSSIAMEIAAELNASFTAANVIGTLLRANLNVRFWRKVLERSREFNAKHVLMFGEHPVVLVEKGRPIFIWRMSGTSEAFVAHRYYQVCSPQQEVPKVTSHDIMCGRIIPRGEFEVLSWKSQIPPYYSYFFSCRRLTSRRRALVKKKRSRLQGI